MDFNKFKYEEAQRAKETRKRSSHLAIKEMKYRVKIGRGDFDTKTAKVEKFLSEGHKVKITIMFRGREVAHPELGMKILDQIADQVTDLAKVEASARLDGRNMTMVLAPDKRAQADAARRRATEETEPGSEANLDGEPNASTATAIPAATATPADAPAPTVPTVPTGETLAATNGSEPAPSVLSADTDQE